MGHDPRRCHSRGRVRHSVKLGGHAGGRPSGAPVPRHAAGNLVAERRAGGLFERHARPRRDTGREKNDQPSALISNPIGDG